MVLFFAAACGAEPATTGPDAWARTMLGTVELGRTDEAGLVRLLGPPLRSYPHPPGTMHVYGGGTIPGSSAPVDRYFLAEGGVVVGLRFEPDGASPPRKEVQTALRPWKIHSLELAGLPVDAVCEIPGLGTGLLLVWAPNGSLGEAVLAPHARWTLPSSPCR